MDTIRIDSAVPTASAITQNSRVGSGWAAGSHLISLFFSFVGAILVAVIVGKDDRFVRQHARQAVNLQLNLCAFAQVTALLSALTPAFILLLLPLTVAAIALPILGAIRANRGLWRPYPALIPFLAELPRDA